MFNNISKKGLKIFQKFFSDISKKNFKYFKKIKNIFRKIKIFQIISKKCKQIIQKRVDEDYT